MDTDLLIFDMGGQWAWASVDRQETRPPLTFVGERMTRRLWRDDGLADDLWEAAKDAWLRAVTSLDRLQSKVAA